MSVSGTVVELWRYPVKSMLGERRGRLELDRRGAVGDRLFAIRDENGKLGSGKDTKRFRRMDGLFSFQAELRGQAPQIHFPDGRLLGGDDPGIDAALSEVFGQPVSLVRETGTSHFDDGPVHLVSTASLGGLRGVAPEGVADARRFRPNIVLAVDGDQPEQAWLGKTVRIGEAELRLTTATKRCRMITLAQSELAEAPEVLRHVAQERGLVLGVYAEVVKPGVVKLGDRVVETVGAS